MNKFTLQFSSVYLEQQYQIYRCLSTIPACKAINLMCFSVCILRSILSLIVHDNLNIFIFFPLGMLVLLVHQSVITNKRQWVDCYLVSINHILMCYQIYTQIGFEVQEAFIFGQTMMIMHIIIILVSDYKYAVIQIIANTGIKLAIAQYFQPSLSFQTYMYTIVVALIILFTLYRTNKQFRESFLYVSSNNSLDWLIPLVVENPFALCVFDPNTQGFSVKTSNLEVHDPFKNKCSASQCLTQLIRNYNINKNSFEQFLLSRRNSSINPCINKRFQLINSKNFSDKIMIKYSEVFVTELTFIIIIDQIGVDNELNKACLAHFETGISQFIGNIRKFLISQLFIIKNFNVSHKTKISQVKINILYLLTKFELNQNLVVEKCKLTKYLRKNIRNFELAFSKQIIIECQSEQLQVTTYKHQFKEMITILLTLIVRLKASNNSKLIIITGHYKECEIIDFNLQISQSSFLFLQLQRNISFKKALSILGPCNKILYDKEIITFRIYSDLTQISNLQSYSQNF